MRTSAREETAAETHCPDASADELLGILSQDPFDQDALRLAEQSAGIGVWSIDLTTGLVRATAQFFRIMGLDPTRELVPIETIRELRHPQDRERVVKGFQQVLQGGKEFYEIEYRIVRPDGSLRWIFGRGRVVRDADGKPLRYSGIDLDITDRKAAEAALAAAKEELERLNRTLEERVQERTAELQTEARRRAEAEAGLHQAQKMEAIGQLTSGIAHDFNNLLQVILGNLEIAKFTLQREPPIGALNRVQERLLTALETARKASESGRELVQRLLAFRRHQEPEPVAFDAAALVTEMVDMARRLVAASIEVESAVAMEAAPVFVDRNQFESAVLNLVVNARDAMPQGGRLTIGVSTGAPEGLSSDDLAPEGYIVVSVCDTGCGIASEHLDKVFDPFFTTKTAGTGSGLGLSMVGAFVKRFRGHVRLESEVGAGTTVRIYLPRMSSASEKGAVESQAESAAALASGHSAGTLSPALARRVLLVDDNKDAVASLATLLEMAGHRVRTAGDARNALSVARSYSPEVVLLDIGLPGGNGYDVARQMRAMPKLKNALLVAITGYDQEADKLRSQQAGFNAHLVKPVQLDVLTKLIGRAEPPSCAHTKPAEDQRKLLND